MNHPLSKWNNSPRPQSNHPTRTSRFFYLSILTTPLWFNAILYFYVDRSWALETDFEAYHFFSSLQLSEGLRPATFLHPASPIHVFSAALLHYFPYLKSYPHLFLNLMHTFSGIIIFVLSIIIDQTIIKKTPITKKICYFLFLYSWPTSLYFIDFYGPDVFIIPLGSFWMLLSIYSIKISHPNRQLLLLALTVCTGGFLLSLKLSNLPTVILSTALLFFYITAKHEKVSKAFILTLSFTSVTLASLIIFTWYQFGGVALIIKSILFDSTFTLSNFQKVISNAPLYYPYTPLLMALSYIAYKAINLNYSSQKSTIIILTIFSLIFLTMIIKACGSSAMTQQFNDIPEYRTQLLLRNFSSFFAVISILPLISCDTHSKSWSKLTFFLVLTFITNSFYTIQQKDLFSKSQNKKSDIIKKGLEHLNHTYNSPIAFWTHYQKTPLLPQTFFLHGNERYAANRFDGRKDLRLNSFHYLHIRNIHIPSTEVQANNIRDADFFIEHLKHVWKIFPLPLVRKKNELFSNHREKISAFAFPTICQNEIKNYSPQNMIRYLNKKGYSTYYTQKKLFNLKWEVYEIISSKSISSSAMSVHY